MSPSWKNSTGYREIRTVINKRVLHINSSRDMRGGERQTRLLIEGLNSRGWESFLVIRADSPFSRRNGLFVKERFPLRMRGELDMITGFRIGRIARDLGISIIHAHTALAHSLGIYAKLTSRAKLVVTRRVDFGLRSGKLSTWKYQQADHVIAISRRIKDILVNSGVPAGKLSLVPSGVNFSSRAEQSEVERIRRELNLSDRIIIGTVAALVRHKDYPTLIRAFRLVADKYPNAVLLALGEGNDKAELEELISEAGLQDKFSLLGFREDVNAFFRLFDVYVQASRLEGLCSSLIEAMHYALPIAATAAGGIPDLIEDNVTGLLSPAENHEILAENMCSLIEDRDLSIKLGVAASRKSENYTADNMVRKTEEVYLKLLEGGNA